MRVVFDCTDHMMSPMVTGTRVRGTELLDWQIARALRDAGHRVEVVTSEEDEYFIEGIAFWPADRYPTRCDVLIVADDLSRIPRYRADRVYVSLNRIDPILAGQEGRVDAFVTLSQNHSDVLVRVNPTIHPEQTRVIGPGVAKQPVARKDPFTMLWSNSPDRGLIHLKRLWPDLIEAVPQARLRITYGLEGYVEMMRWRADQEAVDALELWEWANTTEGVEALPELGQNALADLRARSAVYPYPCVPLMPGSIVHAFAVLEALGAGCNVLLSDADGLPSVFGKVATIVGRGDDYELWTAALVEALLLPVLDQEKTGTRNRRWANKHTWGAHAKAWADLVAGK